MKTIVDGKRYDTAAAELIAENGYSHGGDFHAYHEGLYLTPKGSWFLAGSGGPMSKYSVATGQNEWSGGAKIIPLSKGEAREWLERTGEADALEAHFSSELEDA